ncbi:MAG: MBL fold metallo-hydrolase [Firmicutes bacterium]|nr:MBL fold metallo-hydrolase [Bacillota bacterium]
MGSEMSRRDLLKISGVALGGIMLGGAIAGCGDSGDSGGSSPSPTPTTDPDVFIPGEALAADEMRISFMGTSVVPRLTQECNSVFVELGNGDSFVFDCGSGISAKYVAMGVTYSKMDKIFITHLHGDHTSDIITIYCFGPSMDRKTPLYVYGPSADNADEGVTTFCDTLKKLMKWHIESFSFLPTGLVNGEDGYDIVPTELPYMETGVAYNQNGVKITHFPAVHDRDGSISYKLEWNGLSMIFTGDTKPNNYVLENAKGVDVLIHEMVVPPSTWVEKNTGLYPGDQGYDVALQQAQAIQDSSHTPQKALGYILSKTTPRLGIATHFQSEEDTDGPAYEDVRSWYQGPFTIAKDLLVVNVSKNEIRQRYAKVSPNAWYPVPKFYSQSELADPKYPTPLSQLNNELLANVIPEEVYDPQS